jgi:hypothetical protein
MLTYVWLEVHMIKYVVAPHSSFFLLGFGFLNRLELGGSLNRLIKKKGNKFLVSAALNVEVCSRTDL